MSSDHPATATQVLQEADRRRTFAVISHPDAGKSTLTEALALHAQAITSAGAVHGKGGRRGVTSDWMELEKERGISVTSAALQFGHRDHVMNLVDTPGHADFSEDTYRVLAAVDCAIMLVDAAKGLEEQTRKLFSVCRHRGVPVITFINKWDRRGRESLDLLEDIENILGITPVPMVWPVGAAGNLRGLVRAGDTEQMLRFTRVPGGTHKAVEERLTAEQAAAEEGPLWETALEELELVLSSGPGWDPEAFRAGKISPVFFGAALTNIGVGLLLDAVVDLAPEPGPRPLAAGGARPVDSDFTGLVFKIQANMDPAHRDRIAFVRVCSGVFERGMNVTRAASGRSFATKYAHTVFGAERTVVDTSYPGDVVGLINATALRVGDTLYAGKKAEFPALPAFAPEHFAVARPKDISRSKQFRKGISQLDEEGVVQVLVSDRRGDQAPVLAAVGPMQFDVVLHRMEHEFSSAITLDYLPYNIARVTDPEGAATLNRQRLVNGEVLTRRSDEVLLALFADKWQMNGFVRSHPEVKLETLIATAD
ncbi:peptide chain release factor 3 [Streptacidiphilus sp. P02-A3a]|uniref:peptide chain release factor 3 n=1 Tax=Streptacidiphilus sp. P02-A3a TaxID=2704468 RepID=UPI001CDB6BDB|nr:peptide chain release factor 3 [Streptacidiphilus sp. P02-A3a]